MGSGHVIIMYMKKLVYYATAFALCFGCTEPNTRQRMEVIEMGSVSTSPKQAELSLSALNLQVEVLPLETNDSCLLNKITQLEDTDYLWIVSDRQLYQFDKQGSFIKMIGQRGQGPSEYVAVEHIQVDGQQKRIYVLDYFGRKLMVYDYEGSCLKTWPLPEDYALNRISLQQGQLYYTSYTNSIRPDLYAVNLNTGQMDTISIHEREMGQEAFAGMTFVYSLQGKSHLYHYFNDTVYTIAQHQLTPAYLFELGNTMFTYGQLTVTGDNQTAEPLSEPKIEITNFLDLESLILISYQVKTPRQKIGERDNRFALYDKQHRTMHTDVVLTNPSEKMLGLEAGDPVFASSDERAFYTFKQAFDLADKGLLENLNAEDNPVLVKFTSCGSKVVRPQEK